jgi:S1-C subfamily serine protease
VDLLDTLLLAFIALAALSGYRRGALLQIITYIGLACGLVAGSLLGPALAGSSKDAGAQAAIVVGTILACGAVGDGLGWLAGNRVRARARETRARTADAVAGSAISAFAVLFATWFLALNLVNGPFPTIARQIKGSAVVGALGATLPQPPSLVGEVRRFLNVLGFPDVFLGLPPDPGAPVRPPTKAQANAAFRAAQASTVEITGHACDVVLEGSGFAVADGYVVTNAHVVAGETDPQVTSRAGTIRAVPVLFDPRLDIAVLRVPGLHAPALPLAPTTVPRGTDGAVLGYPQGGPLTGNAAAVRAEITAVGRDIYGTGQISRDVYELQTTVRPGNSGGPFTLPTGTVAGVVFAASTTDPKLGYAIASTEVQPLIDQAVGRIGAVGTGACTR